jgi:hypothetical protein
MVDTEDEIQKIRSLLKNSVLTLRKSNIYVANLENRDQFMITYEELAKNMRKSAVLFEKLCLLSKASMKVE